MCPVCAVRGEITIEGGKMKAKWNEEDTKTPRFSYEGIMHRMEWLGKHYFANPQYFKTIDELTEKHKKYGKIIKPKKS
jgi:hypothetical protein